MGTDTGGSIRIPAGLCGIAGLKPTYGLVSRKGVIPCAPSLDHCGPMAWTTEDCALLLAAIAGHDPGDPASSRVDVPHYVAHLTPDLGGMRIGVVRHFWEANLPVSPEAAVAMDAALEVLARLGATLTPVRLRSLGEYNDVRVMLQEPEVFANHQAELARDPGVYGRDFLGRCLAGCLVGAHVYVQASRQRRRMIEQMRAAMDGLDALVTIGPGPAPRLDAERTFGFVHALWGKHWRQPVLVEIFRARAATWGRRSPRARRRTATRSSWRSNTHAVNASLYNQLPFDPIRDFTPVRSSACCARAWAARGCTRIACFARSGR